jgi:hypothetical protein
MRIKKSESTSDAAVETVAFHIVSSFYAIILSQSFSLNTKVNSFWRRMRMNKFLPILFSASLIFFVSQPVDAAIVNPFSPSLSQIQGMGFAWDGANTTSGPLSVTNQGTAIRFSASMQYGDGSADGWASMGVGYPWPPPVTDLSAYDGYMLSFLNTNNSSWFVNIYFNTGWTDPPYSEPDNFYENGWVELLPGVATTVSIDFDTANPLYLNHVTNIGSEIGANMDEYPMWNPNNPSNGDIYHIDVSQIPEPLTLVLLGLGGIALRQRKK